MNRSQNAKMSFLIANGSNHIPQSNNRNRLILRYTSNRYAKIASK
jgi:hypothetical protein